MQYLHTWKQTTEIQRDSFPLSITVTALRMSWFLGMRQQMRGWYRFQSLSFKPEHLASCLALWVRCHFREQVWLFCGFYCLCAQEPQLLFSGYLSASHQSFRSRVWPRALQVSPVASCWSQPRVWSGLLPVLIWCVTHAQAAPYPRRFQANKGVTRLSGAMQGKAELRHSVLMRGADVNRLPLIHLPFN